ncbi:ComEC/Rec2 family competence protein [Haloplanus natans]|uniref:ComEC/Rec2 family competence protein n=1 Tax=Haloplanus natans TaxID=376171 RepID=UPI0006779089|nr:MBL fold metallo-hydrolase [Haloplanus natans]
MTDSRDEICIEKFNVGHADLTLIHLPTDPPVVIDTAYIGDIEDFYDQSETGRTIPSDSVQHCFLTHFDEDHVSGLAELIARTNVGTVSQPYPFEVARTAADDTPGISDLNLSVTEALEPQLTSLDRSILDNTHVARNYALMELLAQDRSSIESKFPDMLDPTKYSKRAKRVLEAPNELTIRDIDGTDRFSFHDDAVTVDVLWPATDVLTTDANTDTWTINELSGVFRVTTPNQTHLFTGDISGRVEAELCARARRAELKLEADILHASHHGATEDPDRSAGRTVGNSERFLGQVAPTHLIISSGTSGNYGHPDPALFDRCADHGIEVLWTGVHGHIRFNQTSIETAEPVSRDPYVLKAKRGE